MTINQWFQKMFYIPLFLVMFILTAFFSFLIIMTLKNQRQITIDNLDKLVVNNIILGVQQSNRSLVESSITTSIRNLGVKEVLYCIDDKVIFSNKGKQTCKANLSTNWNEIVTTFNLPGYSGHKIFFLIPRYEVSNELIYVLILTFLASAAIFILNQNIKKYLIRDILKPIENNFLFSSNSVEIIELKNIGNNLKLINESKAKNEISRQVAHDIRSPLTALNILLNETTTPNEIIENSTIISSAVKRINTIANDLLKTSEINIFNKKSDDTLIELNSVTSHLLEEKKVEFRHLSSLKIKFTSSSSFLLSEMPESDLKRVLSNLINNAIEAIKSESIKIDVNIKSDSSFCYITISDNGVGIDSSLMEKLNSQLQITTKSLLSSKSGCGIGVLSSHQTLSKVNGRLTYSKNDIAGTIATITLPKLKCQNTFADRLAITNPNKTLIVIDDDESIYKLWEEKFNALNSNLKVKYLNSPEQFQDYLNQAHLDDIGLILCDNRFANSNITGLDLLSTLKLNVPTYLVTTQVDSKSIIERTESLNIKIIPKALLPKLQLHTNDEVILKQVDAILIDDDEQLIHAIWNYQAERMNKKLLCFKSFNSFKNSKINFNKSTPIYIDRQLGDDESGDEVAKTLNDNGFMNLFLATGDPSGLAQLSFLKGVVGKHPPW